MISRRMWMGMGVALVGLVLAACGRQGSHATSVSSQPQEEKRIVLNPQDSTWRLSVLTGELQNLRVAERVDEGTGKVTEPPMLRATVTVRNTSADRTIRLIAARVEYLGADGKPIPLPKNRQNTSFVFAYQPENLDPGKAVSTQIEVPFPSAALKSKKLQDIRVDLQFTPLPYKDESVNLPESISG
jgi:hypothetical protein